MIDYTKEQLIELVNYAKEKLGNIFKITEHDDAVNFYYGMNQQYFTGYEKKNLESIEKNSKIFEGILPIRYEYINPISIEPIEVISCNICISISIPKRKNSRIFQPFLHINAESPFFSAFSNNGERIVIGDELIRKTFSDVTTIIDEKSLESFYHMKKGSSYLDKEKIDLIAKEYKDFESFFKRLYQLYIPKFQSQYRTKIESLLKERNRDIKTNERYAFFEKVIKYQTEVEEFLKDKD